MDSCSIPWLSSSVPLSSLLTSKHPLLDLQASVPIYHSFHTFYTMNITSAPLYHHPSSSSSSSSYLTCNNKHYIGVVSVSDMLSYVLSKKNTERALQDPVENAIGATKESLLFFIANDNTPLSEVIHRFSSVLHRCLVFPSTDQDKLPAKLLTQTDVIKFLLDKQQEYPQLEDKFKITVESICKEDELMSIKEYELLPQGLELLHIHPAVAVVNEKGQVVSTLSASDMRSLWRDLETAANKSSLLSSLSTMTVKEFLMRNSPVVDSFYPRSAVCITQNATLADAAEYMVRHHIHRVWIVDTVNGVEGIGIGCLTYTDIIRSLHNM